LSEEEVEKRLLEEVVGFTVDAIIAGNVGTKNVTLFST